MYILRLYILGSGLIGYTSPNRGDLRVVLIVCRLRTTTPKVNIIYISLLRYFHGVVKFP